MEQYILLMTVVHPNVGIYQLHQYQDECIQARIILNQTLSEVLKKEVGEDTKAEIREFKKILYLKSKSKGRGVEEDLFECLGRMWIPTNSSEDTVWSLLLQLAAVTKLLKRIKTLM